MFYFCTVAFLAGVSCLLWSPWQVSLLWIFFPALASSIAYYFLRKPALACLLAFCFGVALSHIQAQKVLLGRLPNALEGEKVEVLFEVLNLPHKQDSKVEMIAQILQWRTKSGQWVKQPLGKTKVSWKTNSKQILPQDIWQVTLKLKCPRGYLNPGGIDRQKYYFENRITNLGFVELKAPQKLIARSNIAFRAKIKQFVEKTLSPNLAGPILALSIGEKSGITQADWQIFQRTGTAHLMAISGLHIGFIAGFCFLGTGLLLRFIPTFRLTLFLPRKWLAAACALIGSGGYALLSGLSIPSQRAWIMLLIFLGGILTNKNISLLRSFCLSLWGVLLFDALAVLSAGFWLSFIAVGVILLGFSGFQRQRTLWWQFGRIQWVMFIGLLPFSIYYFGQASLISPVVNAFIVPLVSFLVVPAALIGSILALFWEQVAEICLQFSAWQLKWILGVIEFFAHFPILTLPKPTLLSLIFSVMGMMLLLMPNFIRGKNLLGACLFLPLFFSAKPNLLNNHLHFTLLDVGQGLSTVVQTKNHTLVYDTGPKMGHFEAGSQILLPFLKAKQIDEIDMLILSHGDLDHIGGAGSLLERFSIKNLLSSDLSQFNAYNPLLCEAGQRWIWDGILFEILHPKTLSQLQRSKKIKRNNHSCVLKVSTGAQSILLTGDIEKAVEKNLIARFKTKLESTILVVPHHGSKTSSSQAFIEAVKPQYALIARGYLNRYGHPKPEIRKRYVDFGATVLDTVETGAITFELNEKEIQKIEPYLLKHWRIWHNLSLCRPS